MVEHLVCNQGVVGSNPVASTNLARTSATPGRTYQIREKPRFRRSSSGLFGESSPNGTRRSLFFENEVDRERW